MTIGSEDHDDPAGSARRTRFSLSRSPKIKGDSELIAHVGRAQGIVHNDDLQLDLTAFLVGSDDKVPFGDRHYCVFYNNPLSTDRSTRFLEDEDDSSEFVRVHLHDVGEEVAKVIFAVSIYDADVLSHTFGKVTDARFWIEGEFVNTKGGLAEIHTDNLSDLFPDQTAVVIGEVYRSSRGWEYRKLGTGHTYPSLIELARVYGVKLSS